MNARWRRARILLRRWDRDLLALAAIACIAIGLSTVAIALSWLAVGVFLMVAASGPRRSA
jgi:apolipoprotein N-acyltransferase